MGTRGEPPVYKTDSVGNSFMRTRRCAGPFCRLGAITEQRGTLKHFLAVRRPRHGRRNRTPAAACVVTFVSRREFPARARFTVS